MKIFYFSLFSNDQKLKLKWERRTDRIESNAIEILSSSCIVVVSIVRCRFICSFGFYNRLSRPGQDEKIVGAILHIGRCLCIRWTLVLLFLQVEGLTTLKRGVEKCNYKNECPRDRIESSWMQLNWIALNRIKLNGIGVWFTKCFLSYIVDCLFSINLNAICFYYFNDKCHLILQKAICWTA